MSKRIKKLVTAVVALLMTVGTISFSAGNTNNQKQTANNPTTVVQAAKHHRRHHRRHSKRIRVSFTLKNVKRHKIASKSLRVKKNTTVMTAMKKAWKVKETKGFVTSIHGHSQNAKKKIYWMYYVNGKLASVGASQYKLHNKDHVTWILEKSKY